MYGARALPTPSEAVKDEKSEKHDGSTTASTSCIKRLLHCVAACDVPHSYFTQFYVIAVFLSLFWGVQIMTRGTLFQAVAQRIGQDKIETSMSFDQILLCWSLFTVQGCRRLYECVTLTKPSNSRMWLGHYIFGCVYYVAMSLAIWIEGTGRTEAHRKFLVLENSTKLENFFNKNF